MKRKKWREIFDEAIVKAGYNVADDELDEWYPDIAKQLSTKHLEFVLSNKLPQKDGWEGSWNPLWFQAVKDEFVERSLLS